MIPSWKQRLHQSLWYEGLALALVLPVVDKIIGHAGTALWLLISISAMVCCWTPMFNAVFDKYFKAASLDTKRHWKIRTLHALMLEFSILSMTTPLVAWWAGVAMEKALYLNFQLSLFYIAYAYVFFVLWDKTVVHVQRRRARTTES